MTTYYEKRLATELPKEEGQYLTDLGMLSFRNFKELTPEQGKVFSFNQHTEKFTVLEEGWFDSDVILVCPKWWLSPLPSPIPSMTLEECKDKAAKHFGYKNYNEAEVLHVGSPLIDMQAEIIQLSAYALSLKQEVEELKKDQEGMISVGQAKNLISLAWATASAYGDKTDEADCQDWIKHNL